MFRKQKEQFGIAVNNKLSNFSSAVLLSIDEGLSANAMNEIRSLLRNDEITLQSGKKSLLKKILNGGISSLYDTKVSGALILAAFNGLKFNIIKKFLAKNEYGKSMNFISASFDSKTLDENLYSILCQFNHENDVYGAVMLTILSASYFLYHLLNYCFVILVEKEGEMSKETRKTLLNTIEEDAKNGECPSYFLNIAKAAFELKVEEALECMKYMTKIGIQPAVSSGSGSSDEGDKGATQAAEVQYELEIVDIKELAVIPACNHFKTLKQFEGMNTIEIMKALKAVGTKLPIIFNSEDAAKAAAKEFETSFKLICKPVK